jgi:hypothetical protein
LFCTQIYFFGNVLPFCIWQNNFVMNASIFPSGSQSFQQKRTIATFLNHFDHNTIASTVLPSQVVSFRWTGCPEPRDEHLHFINGQWGARHRWGGMVAQVEGYVWMWRRRLAAAEEGGGSGGIISQ